MRHIYAYFLAQDGYSVIEAWSVATALMHLDVGNLRAVVLDLWLPNGRGEEVVEAMIAKRNDVGTVILSAAPEEYEVEWPVVERLKKPASHTTFLRAVHHAEYMTSEGIQKLRENVRRLSNMTTG